MIMGLKTKTENWEQIVNLDCKQSSKFGNSESRDWKHEYMIENIKSWLET